MDYKVKLNFFEGPLDLLLFLIKKERIDIYDIPIGVVTEQYLAYLELMELLDLNIAGEFLVMAASLMHIKSKMLLPEDENNEAEEELDPREELVKRLLEYKKFKEASVELAQMRAKNKDIFIREVKTQDDGIDVGGERYFEASLFDLISAFKIVLKNVPKETFHSVVKDKFTVSDKIHAIYHLLSEHKKITFLSLFQTAAGKDEIIATFLAVLELIKLKEIIVVQKDPFGDINIIRNQEIVYTGAGADAA